MVEINEPRLEYAEICRMYEVQTWDISSDFQNRGYQDLRFRSMNSILPCSPIHLRWNRKNWVAGWMAYSGQESWCWPIAPSYAWQRGLNTN